MADIRINSLPSTATSFNTDDYIAIDGASGGTRKMLAATLPLTDVTLGGSSGPSVKSSLSARAPRQGLVFDGSGTYATLTVPAFGTGDFTASAWVREDNSFAGTPVVMIGSGVGGFYMEFDANGFPYVALQGGAGVLRKATTACVVKKLSLITYVKTSGTGIWYVNGIAAGSDTDSNNYTGGIATLSSSAPYNLTGYVSPLIYNRALSASEVVSLYEAGAPVGADYGASGTPASNTSLITGADSTFSAGYTWNLTGSVSITGGEAVWTGGGAIYNPTGLTVTSGKKYRVTIDITQASTNGWNFAYGSGYIPSGISGTGVKSYEFTATATGGFGVQNGDGPDGKLTSITLLPIGLLLAPDAAQAGGGLTWYDTSGNAANITLPASGVSWNVPTSGKLAGNLTVNGGQIQMGGTNPYIQGTTGTGYIQFQNGGDVVVASNSGRLVLASNGVTNATLFTTGNFLVGTGSSDGGQKLQVSGGNARISYAGNNPKLDVVDGSIITKLQSLTAGDTAGWVGTESNHTFRIVTNNTTAATFDTSQNATFAGTIKPQQAATASAPSYVKGAIYFDTTLNKLRVGGATGWETITSV